MENQLKKWETAAAELYERREPGHAEPAEIVLQAGASTAVATFRQLFEKFEADVVTEEVQKKMEDFFEQVKTASATLSCALKLFAASNPDMLDTMDIGSKPSSRHERAGCLERDWPFAAGTAIPIKQGGYLWGKKQYIVKQPNGSVTFSKGMYADDIVAFLLSTLKDHLKNGETEVEARSCLAAFIDLMDERALKRHGYSGNQEEAALKWERLANLLHGDRFAPKE